MRHFKKLFSALLIAAVLGAAVPARQANAGVLVLVGTIATPWAIPAGAALVVFGMIYDSLLLIVLDENGNATQTTLESALAQKYPFIEDQQALADLASLIREKALAQQPDAEGRILVSVSEEEIYEILEPTGMLESNPESVAILVDDLK